MSIASADSKLPFDIKLTDQKKPQDTVPMATLESKLQDILSDVLKTSAIEEAFCGFVLHSQEDDKTKIICCLEAFRTFWKSVPQEAHEGMMQYYVAYIHSLKSHQRIKLLCDMLCTAVEKAHIPPKLICDCLLKCDKLTYTNSDLWCQTFIVIRKVIGGVDYKGCRDLLRVILEKIQTIPVNLNISSLKQLEVATKVVSYILDRNACLLPSYLAINEIRNLYNDKKRTTHWGLGEVLSNFVDSFRPTAHMASITGRPKLLPVVGHSGATGNAWKLETSSLTFILRGLLPYDKELCRPQTELLRYVLEQPYSRDMVCSMLGLNKQQKQRCPVLEEQLVDLVLVAMERTESEEGSTDGGAASQLLWQHLSSQLIFFVLFQFASFPHMVLSLHEKLSKRNLTKGRDHLMWVLLQFISGSIQKNPLSEFLPVMKLFELLYPEKENLPVPDINKPQCTHAFAMTCIWIHLNKKAQNRDARFARKPGDDTAEQRALPHGLQETLDASGLSKKGLGRDGKPVKKPGDDSLDQRSMEHKPIPQALKEQLDFLQQSFNMKTLPMTDYRIALLCNAYSTNTDYFPLPMGVLVEFIYGSSSNKTTTPMPGLNCIASGPTTPLTMSLLDSLTIHAKMSLIHSIVTKVIKMAQSKITLALAPALVETYSRLLVYMEIESLGIKGFISQLLPNVFRSHAWGILHTLLEMFSYRLHHIQPHYRVQLLSHLHSLTSVPQTNQHQLHLCVEATALRLITGLGSVEVQPQLSRFLNDPKQLLSGESEELNRALVLTIARAMHVTGNWCKEILTTLVHNTPHNWASHTLSCFPVALQQFFRQNPATQENRAVLKKNVEDEFKKWKTMTNETEIVNHFSQGTPALFLCLLWKMFLDSDRVNQVAPKVLERIGARALSAHIRTFADFLVYEFSTSVAGQHVNKCIETLNDMIWKYNIVALDKLVLSLALRNHEGNEAQVCFFIIQLLLLKTSEFRNRVSEFVKENSPEHWLQTDWHTKHMAFHRKYPEKFYFEGLQDYCGYVNQTTHQYLPIYFGNVCLRFLPVFDIVIHRFLELPPVSKSLETLLDHLGGLYKFHDRPVTYLYNTLHYYERRLRDRPPLKRKLVAAIIGSLKDIRPPGWCLSSDYMKFIAKPIEEINWIPDQTYYHRLMAKLVDTISGSVPAPNIDWRFNEFPNPAAHALHTTCVELMALPVNGKIVGNAIMDVVLKYHTMIAREDIMKWMNGLGLVLTSLPEPYWMSLHERVLEVMKTDIMTSTNGSSLSGLTHPFAMFDFTASHSSFSEMTCAYIIALTHSVWHHSSIGQLTMLPQFFKEQVKPLVKTEEQFLFVCHLVGPFLQRFHQERTRCLIDLTIELYEMLEQVDKNVKVLNHMDSISDFLYHIKYMFTGDLVKHEVERCIKNLKQPMQMRLRFITHISKGHEQQQQQPLQQQQAQQ
ncbi:mediator of RNA polymerase II transcription subunit 23-like isoform X2 [Ptychodera flava]|uniref:mediator of RNA polymerase II transcription subunit 23-like isoform X2 n=1 Tax=Ptychodera flava TaxID=63121 RepID=UPI003969C534